MIALATPEHREPLYVGGVSRTSPPSRRRSPPPRRAARLLEMLEHQVVVVSLVRELLEPGLTVRIGAENQLDELRECAIVLAPYEVDGQAAGHRRRARARPAWTTATRSPRSRPSRSSSGGTSHDPRLTTRSSACRARRPTTRSSAPTASSPGATTPTATPVIPQAEERFKEVSVAYETLRDPERRRRYDVFGDGGGGVRGRAAPVATQFGFGDLFDAFFGGDPFGMRPGADGGPARGADAEAVIELTLVEAAFGTTNTIDARLPVECPRCDGSGCEPGTHPSRCDVCGGEGEIRQVRRSILGQIVTASPCGVCEGTGRRILTQCHDCRGDGRVMAQRSIDVEVPAGVDDGTRLRLAGRGPAAPRGGPPGDLYVTVRVAAHPDFERQGDDLLHVRRIGDRAGCARCRARDRDARRRAGAVVPPGTQPGQVFRLKGAGVPSLRGRGRGDLLVRVDVEVPTQLDDEEAELLHRLADHRGEEVAPPAKGVFSRLRSAFQ